MAYTQEDFVLVVLAEFPELRSEFAECDGMLHLQMGCFARLMQAAKGESDWPAYTRGVLAAQHLWQRPDDALFERPEREFLGEPRFQWSERANRVEFAYAGAPARLARDAGLLDGTRACNSPARCLNHDGHSLQ